MKEAHDPQFLADRYIEHLGKEGERYEKSEWQDGGFAGEGCK